MLDSEGDESLELASLTFVNLSNDLLLCSRHLNSEGCCYCAVIWRRFESELSLHLYIFYLYSEEKCF